MEKVHIIGIGDDGLEGLTPSARQRLQQAQLILGARHALAAIESLPAQKMDIGGDLDLIIRRIEAAAGQSVAILASGDPLFYGTARYLCDRLGKDRFEVTPHVSSMTPSAERAEGRVRLSRPTSAASPPTATPSSRYQGSHCGGASGGAGAVDSNSVRSDLTSGVVAPFPAGTRTERM